MRKPARHSSCAEELIVSGKGASHYTAKCDAASVNHTSMAPRLANLQTFPEIVRILRVGAARPGYPNLAAQNCTPFGSLRSDRKTIDLKPSRETEPVVIAAGTTSFRATGWQTARCQLTLSRLRPKRGSFDRRAEVDVSDTWAHAPAPRTDSEEARGARRGHLSRMDGLPRLCLSDYLYERCGA